MSLRYHTLTVPEEEAANCLLINGSLLVPHMSEIPLSSEVHFGYILYRINNIISRAGFQATDSLSNKRNSFVRVSKDWPWTFILMHFNKKIKKYQKALIMHLLIKYN